MIKSTLRSSSRWSGPTLPGITRISSTTREAGPRCTAPANGPTYRKLAKSNITFFEVPMIEQIFDPEFFANRSILITGGTGSLGNELVSLLLEHASPRRIVIFSRDEYKQFVMAEKFRSQSTVLRFFLGDVRDKDRLKRAFEGVDYVIHAAALKQVPAAEYNPFEFVKTNVVGAENVIDAAIDTGIKRVAALSTDKAANPTNLYGATKL